MPSTDHLRRRTLHDKDSADTNKGRQSPKSPKLKRSNAKSPGTPKSGRKKDRMYPDLDELNPDNAHDEDLDTTSESITNEEGLDELDSSGPGSQQMKNYKGIYPKIEDIDPKSSSGDQQFNKLWLILIIPLLVVFFVLYLHITTPTIKTAEQKQTLKNVTFQEKFMKVKKQYPSQTKRFWRVIDSQLRRLLSTENPRYPAILLVGVPTTGVKTADCFSKQLVQTVNSVFELHSQSYINAADLSKHSPADAKLKLDNGLQRVLNVGKGVVLDHIEKLPAEGALMLHGYCDGDNAPYKQAVIVLVFHTQDDYESLDDKTFEEKLTELWEADLGRDEMPALRSRVANNVVIVKPEDNVTC